MSKNSNFGLYAIAVAIAVVGALWLGVPIGTLAILGLVIACPLMMMMMMGGMHGGGHGDDNGEGHGGCGHDHGDNQADHQSHSHR